MHLQASSPDTGRGCAKVYLLTRALQEIQGKERETVYGVRRTNYSATQQQKGTRNRTTQHPPIPTARPLHQRLRPL